MKYSIKRGINEYGPYTLAELQRYVAQGNIALSDLTRSEGMTDWVPVSQVIGDIPVPVTAPAMPAAGGTVYAGAGSYGAAATPAMASGPVPPDFHWGLVLLIGVVTCGLFLSAWLIVEAAWIQKIKPGAKSLVLVILAVVASYASAFMGGGVTHADTHPLGALFWLAGIVLHIVAIFSMRSELEDYYNSVEPIYLQLSGVMTFFFAVFYFQHHFSRIARWKKTGVLAPQG
ncbi:MAG TPA: DUF4339 domain-containing protein [Candidatus Angelobacter sp.]|nr:DUF4339 domain-containing protein [Candidatus Angelobacter sp.]